MAIQIIIKYTCVASIYISEGNGTPSPAKLCQQSSLHPKHTLKLSGVRGLKILHSYSSKTNAATKNTVLWKEWHYDWPMICRMHLPYRISSDNYTNVVLLETIILKLHFIRQGPAVLNLWRGQFQRLRIMWELATCKEAEYIDRLSYTWTHVPDTYISAFTKTSPIESEVWWGHRPMWGCGMSLGQWNLKRVNVIPNDLGTYRKWQIFIACLNKICPAMLAPWSRACGHILGQQFPI